MAFLIDVLLEIIEAEIEIRLVAGHTIELIGALKNDAIFVAPSLVLFVMRIRGEIVFEKGFQIRFLFGSQGAGHGFLSLLLVQIMNDDNHDNAGNDSDGDIAGAHRDAGDLVTDFGIRSENRSRDEEGRNPEDEDPGDVDGHRKPGIAKAIKKAKDRSEERRVGK